ncbi:MAG: CotH kinase family protein [Saprospiraceae bacterium]
MKYFSFPALLAMLFFAQNLWAQNLPNSMYFAESEHTLYTNGRVSEGLYDESTLRDFHLWFAQPDYWQQLKNNYPSKTDLPATMVVEGDTFFNVGVRFKGQTSYSQTQNSDKKSFNITMDYAVAGQDLDGYSTLNLNNCFEDASFMREVSYLHQIRRHIPAARANYVRLFINGTSWGIYPNVQQLDGDYLKEWFFSNDGTRWRADRPAGGGGGGGPMWGDGTAGLNYLGADTALYKVHYTLKTANKPNPWDDLVNVCKVLNTTPLSNLETEMAEVLDLDRTLWFLASEIAFSDDDSYVFKGRMDYYLYWDPETQRMTPLEFDGNSVMKNNAVNWGVFYNETKVNYPLLNRLLAVPSIRQRYLAHFRTLVADEMNTTEFNALVDQYDAVINAGVQTDTKKLYSFNQYGSEKQTIKTFVQNHRNTLLNHFEMTAVGPSISNATMTSAAGAWADPLADAPVTVTATITSASGISAVSLFHCPAAYGHFTKTTMYDDGQHNDGAASDGVFGGQIPGFATGTLVRFYLEAAANNTAKTVAYLPVGAEHDVFYYKVGAAWVENPPVVINEIMASNTTTAADEEDEYEDWIELHNLTNAAVDLTGYALSDNPANPQKWIFPAGISIPANGYLIVWADEDGTQGPLHASFKLSASGESLSLVDSQGYFLDTLSFGQQVTDMGYARLPNGTGPFVIQAPTFGGFNGTVPTLEPGNSADNAIAVAPNPASEILNIHLLGEKIEGLLLVTDATGRTVLATEAQPTQTLPVADWPAGMYFLKWGNVAAKVVLR